jgi:peptidoglycan/LPS O-acetylase OafA/YrhL
MRAGVGYQPNLDLARSIAILMVLAFHCIQWLSPGVWLIRTYYPVGAFGVDLFFALSGYLIGGIYWREYHKQGQVQPIRFMLRRALRTMPPYFVALVIAYAGVRFARGEPFDWRYLLFLQNYHDSMPYFVISWSLCIEEHFYVALPLILAVLLRVATGSVVWWLLLLALVPTMLRAAVVEPTSMEFGYSTTATHLRFDGLLFGVIAAYARATVLRSFVAAPGLRWAVSMLAIGFLLVQPFIPVTVMYVYGFLTLALIFAGLVLVWDASPAFRLADNGVNRSIARSSYSVYLTHAVAVHVAVAAAAAAGLQFWLGQLVIMAALIAVAGWCMYRWIERPTIALRDRLVP